MRADLRALLPVAMLFLLAAFRPELESSMTLHMAIELPALFAVGWLANDGHGALNRMLGPYNAHGIPGLLAATLATMFWMVPAALDLAVLAPAIGLIKAGSLIAAGALLRGSWREAPWAIQAFFLFNWVWMTLTAGLLYQQLPEQLCSTYLQGDQVFAGIAIVAIAVAVLAAGLTSLFLEQAE